MKKTLLTWTIAILATASLSAQTFDFSTPSDDRWHYPFNFTPGTRVLSSTFGATGTGVPAFQNFNDRDGVILIAWDTSAMIAPGQDPAAYNIESITVTITNEPDAVWAIDLTSDEWFTFDINNDTLVNPDGIPRGEPGDIDGESDDPDPGRPLELFGVDFGPFFDFTGWVETDPYAGGTDLAAAPRDPFAFVYKDSGGDVLHVEDHVDGLWNDALGVGSFTPTPWAIGVPQAYAPGAQADAFDITFEIDLSLWGALSKAYFQEQLNQGRLMIVVTSMIETVELGTPGTIPSIYLRESVGAFVGAKAPQLQIVLATALPGDLDGNGCVELTDLAIMLANFGTPSGALPEDGDLDDDGDVDLADLAVMLSNFGQGTCQP